MSEKEATHSAEGLPETRRKELAEELSAAVELAARYRVTFSELSPGDWNVWEIDGLDGSVAKVLNAVDALEDELERRHPDLSRFQRLDVVRAATAIIRGDDRRDELPIPTPRDAKASTSTADEQRAKLRLRVARRPPGWRPAS